MAHASGLSPDIGWRVASRVDSLPAFPIFLIVAFAGIGCVLVKTMLLPETDGRQLQSLDDIEPREPAVAE